MVYILIFAAITRLCLREFDEAWRLAHHSVTVAREQGFLMYLALGTVLQNCAALQRGDLQAGSVTMKEALATYRATGAQLLLPFCLALLVEGHLQAGSIRDGLQLVTEALRMTETNLDSFWEAEMYRLKGELILQSEVRGPESPEKNHKAKGKRQK